MSDEKSTTPTAQLDAPADGNMNDLTSLIQGVLQQTQDRFQHMSDQIIRRIDDMTTRIDDLEKNINDLLQSNQVEHPPSAQ
ncbi:Heat shock factor-binding protein 1 [Caenorhabditis elegans]|uniref:Heat shock factor-binding protein 1 n=1 Tax=Caenorhabditis elegans TaxID=6239 RepID=Q9U3B7_CAEEL|nr:Heat shock factor-binding protein 1 [Caenorhabditis elegans]CAB01233.2 Heat shock factor-binding protein 1 [Caenorhabditis elegans]|eukprot:NP_502406.1 Heat Shock factor Binding protein [Caenorhabditis elegans]